jgi:thymidine kinase
MDVYPSLKGSIEVICGPMFAGKSEEALRRIRRELYAGRDVHIYTRDERYEPGQATTHNGTPFPKGVGYTVVTSTKDIDPFVQADVVLLEEGQFFGDLLADACQSLARRGKRVIVTGLDMDYLERPFENMALLMAVAEYVTKLSAVCVRPNCHEPATRTYRKVSGDGRELQGAGESYDPLCRHCYIESTR